VSDAELLTKFVKNQDERAFEALVERYASMVMGVCRRILSDSHDASDAFQAVFVVLSRKAQSLQSSTNVGSWLYRVSVNVSLNAKKRMMIHRTRQEPIDAETLSHPEAEQENDLVETRSLIDEEINHLPEKYRSSLVLCCVEGMSHEEASKHLGVSYDALKQRLMRARDLLRTRLLRRGLVLSSASLAVIFEKDASAAVPQEVMIAATRAGIEPASRALSPEILSLSQSALKAMAMKSLIVWLSVSLLVAVAGLAVSQKMQITSQSQTTSSRNLDKELRGAAANGEVERVLSLLQQGANINSTNSFGQTALMMAAGKVQTNVVQVLLEKGAEIDVEDALGETAFSVSSSRYASRSEPLLLFLLDKGAVIDHQNKLGQTVLMNAASGGQVDLVRFLLDHGANINFQNDRHPQKRLRGETALMRAALNDHREVVELLIQRGADIHLKTSTGETAQSLAANYYIRDRTEIVELLKKAGANKKPAPTVRSN
jgi:RNA polymerase sigma factor (sigma-70 family)